MASDLPEVLSQVLACRTSGPRNPSPNIIEVESRSLRLPKGSFLVEVSLYPGGPDENLGMYVLLTL